MYKKYHNSYRCQTFHVRLLHYYEELGLLKPSFIKANGYRCYEEQELADNMDKEVKSPEVQAWLPNIIKELKPFIIVHMRCIVV